MRFKDICGYQDVKTALIQMAESGRIHHALLFFENEGVGGLAMILAFYQYLCCTNRHDGDSCGECPSCNKISKLIHPDLHFVYPNTSGSKVKEAKDANSEVYLPQWRNLVLANPYFLENELSEALGTEGKFSNIRVPDAQIILSKLSMVSVQGGYKAVVVYLPEKLMDVAANKLLKVVEEPPEKTLFFFITHAPEKILQTIFSRCLCLRLGPLSRQDVASTMVGQFNVDKDDATRYAAISGGSVGVALSHIGDGEERDGYMDLFSDLMNACLSRDLLAALEAGEAIAALDSREKHRAFCCYAGECMRKIFMLKKGMEAIADISENERPFFQKMASACSQTFCQGALRDLDKAVSLIWANVNQKIVFCDLVNRFFLTIGR